MTKISMFNVVFDISLLIFGIYLPRRQAGLLFGAWHLESAGKI